MQLTVPRTITPSISALVERLETERPQVVTTHGLAKALSLPVQHFKVRRTAYELQQRGWLGHLRTRHAWEFLPAARGAALASGDRFIEFRARLAVDPAWPGVLAMESAASLLGLAQRLPAQEVVALPEGQPLPKSLARDFRSVNLELGQAGRTEVGGLPTWNLSGLIVGVATRPAMYRDAVGLAQWLPEVGRRVDARQILNLLSNSNMATRQRAAYLLHLANDEAGAELILAAYPPKETVWFGAREVGGNFHPASKVNDTMLAKFLSAGVGA